LDNGFGVSNGTSGSGGSNNDGPAVFSVSELLAKDSSQDSIMSYLDAMTQSCDDSDPLQQTNRIWFQKSELRGHGGNFRHLQQKIKTMIARVCDYCMNDIGAVYSTKFSPCGRLLASGSLDCRVLLWDVTTKFNKQQLASLNHHSQLVIDVR
jgi:WD40 repeat protein